MEQNTVTLLHLDMEAKPVESESHHVMLDANDQTTPIKLWLVVDTSVYLWTQISTDVRAPLC